MSTYTIPEEFARFIRFDASTDCWIWIGTIDKQGYGRIQINRTSYNAHRFVYRFLVGDVPFGFKLLCKCMEHCVNPGHWELSQRSGRKPKSIGERILQLVEIDKVSGCWRWIGRLDEKGYARITIRNGTSCRPKLAHRLSYEAFVGPIPETLDLDHQCHTSACPGGRACIHRRCVNPNHLKPADRSENLGRGSGVGKVGRAAATKKQRAKKRCKHGHVYTADSLGLYESGTRKFRYCKICAHIRNTSEARKLSRRKHPIHPFAFVSGPNNGL